MLKAVTRQASLVDTKISSINASNSSSGKGKISTAYFFDHYATKEDVAVMVMEEDFLNAEKELVPSVSAKELEHYKRVREQFEKVEEKPASSNALSQTAKGKSIDSEKGIAEWQSPENTRPRSNGKGKGKVVDRKGKGKEKAVWTLDEDDEEEEDHFDGREGGGMVNGSGILYRDKGKGKTREVANRFQEGSVEDDEGLY